MNASVRPRLALAGSIVGAMIVALDGSVLFVAQPSIQRDLSASLAQVQWTSTAYLLAVASLLVLAGRLGDRYGHTRLLLIGSLGFGAASAGIALAPSVDWVIALRAVQGVFGALLQPATLALLRQVYPPDRLGLPVALRTSAIGVAAAAGPLLGGFLVAQCGWRSVFVVNVPIALLIGLFCLAARVREDAAVRNPRRRPEVGGALLLAVALALLVNALAGVELHGWADRRTVGGLLCSAAVTVVLVRHERRSRNPLIPAAVARSVPVTASMAMLLFSASGMFGALFVSTYFLQYALGLAPLDSALRALPMTALMIVGAPVAARVLRMLGARTTALGGTLLVVLGIGWLAGTDRGTGPVVMGAAFAVLGAGYATVMVTATGTVVGDAPPGYAGVVGGLKQTAVNIGPVLGIAVAAGLLPAVGGVRAGQWEGAMGTALLVLAATAALALVPAALLPGARRTGPPPGDAGRGRPEKTAPCLTSPSEV
ncbi:MFS transporter [Streptomyces filamentosus]|uniref:MFS transporter n=1 Tax=Streptomyces filamentosus TaxID=67294 RepID=A0ABY4UP71_STRFL|nr:MFS transporter [Streptomyces filamentosus]USC46020.1 MFS transporter [Streptomyces filamentosus]